jgi:hypothetical protein
VSKIQRRRAARVAAQVRVYEHPRTPEIPESGVRARSVPYCSV